MPKTEAVCNYVILAKDLSFINHDGERHTAKPEPDTIFGKLGAG